eukprot:CAMPEP_0201650958 /NCGR_PEP_ID=MMETSP0493-20130528/42158_1 /ASSEMBLY_ACC=CAM_ASM_000838 /TAXON_ID=420259 /ORGANISM="Thalassiosira gravida, Strain GMp14c1" /LENGTH=67 /DNA_ID=CAMNT_0048127185 /DNA_START=14 /DNA_END=217 /DNA_ORIENTATION=-
MSQEDFLFGFGEAVIVIVNGGGDGGLGIEEAFYSGRVSIAAGFGADSQVIVMVIVRVAFGGRFGLAS